MFKLNRLGIGALVVALVNVFFGDEAIQALGGAEAVSSAVSNFVTLAIGLIAIFSRTTKG